MRNITFTAKGWSDLMEWSKNDRKIFNKISDLIEEAAKKPFKGTGKPEPLKHHLKDFVFLTEMESFNQYICKSKKNKR